MFAALAERKILEALARGEFDGLPGAGRPLEFDEDRLVSDEVRIAYRILKNAGCVPPEVALLREVRSPEQTLAAGLDGEARHRVLRKLQALSLAMAESESRRQRAQQAEAKYHARIVDRLA